MLLPESPEANACALAIRKFISQLKELEHRDQNLKDLIMTLWNIKISFKILSQGLLFSLSQQGPGSWWSYKMKEIWIPNHHLEDQWLTSVIMVDSYLSKENQTKKKNLLLLLSHKSISSVQSLSRVQLFATPWIAAHQASLSITNSRSSLRLTSIESVMPSSHIILCCPLLLLPPIPPSIRVFSNESTLRMRWPKYWSFSFSIIPSKEIPGLISFRMD